ncbi:hypothetical protein [Pengzhenrongella frigida]|uniref:Uncharacterized protein n=1 Tax=Pengzhenrongella frigida TaxID=1259133 RepID=A0A4Q5N085_9MICO|nr:hypothetical protein [Cellulomonas sp. HLT2-17]RYV51425.1 hypothetical protein EUA98_08305 [Cellulomonas sp. HLT2-17]
MNRHMRVCATAVAAALLLLGTAACGPIDAGTALSADFKAWMVDTENVESIDGFSNNALPFSGSADLNVALAPDLTVAEMAVVLRRVEAFRTHQDLSVTATYASTGFTATFPVDGDDSARNTATVELVVDVDTNTEAQTLAVTGPSASSVAVAGPEDFLAAFDALVGIAAAHRPLTFETVRAETADGAFSVQATSPGAERDARTAFAAVAAAYPVLAAHLDDDVLEVRVDAAESVAVAKLVSFTAPGVTATIQFGNVTKGVPGNYDDVDALVVAAKAAGTPTSIDAGPGSMSLSYPTVSEAIAAEAALGALPARARVDVGYRTDDERFLIVDGALAADGFAAALTVLSSSPLNETVGRVSTGTGSLDISTAGYDEPQAMALGQALAATVPSGTAMTVRMGDVVSLRFTSSAVLRDAAVDPFNEFGDDAPQVTGAFLTGWNSHRP